MTEPDKTAPAESGPVNVPAPAGATPAGIADNRRMSERKSLRSKAQVQFAGRPPLDVRTVDISASGMAVVVPANLVVGSTCALQVLLLLKTGRFILQVNARVVHSVFSSSEGGFKVGLYFLSPAPAMAAAVNQYMQAG